VGIGIRRPPRERVVGLIDALSVMAKHQFDKREFAILM
jgi:hypothetical protein